MYKSPKLYNCVTQFRHTGIMYHVKPITKRYATDLESRMHNLIKKQDEMLTILLKKKLNLYKENIVSKCVLYLSSTWTNEIILAFLKKIHHFDNDINFSVYIHSSVNKNNFNFDIKNFIPKLKKSDANLKIIFKNDSDEYPLIKLESLNQTIYASVMNRTHLFVNLCVYLTWNIIGAVHFAEWKMENLGMPKEVRFFQNDLILTTKSNYLARINLENGDIIWRFLLDSNPKNLFILNDIKNICVNLKCEKIKCFTMAGKATTEKNLSNLLKDENCQISYMDSLNFVIYSKDSLFSLNYKNLKFNLITRSPPLSKIYVSKFGIFGISHDEHASLVVVNEKSNGETFSVPLPSFDCNIDFDQIACFDQDSIEIILFDSPTKKFAVSLKKLKHKYKNPKIHFAGNNYVQVFDYDGSNGFSFSYTIQSNDINIVRHNENQLMFFNQNDRLIISSDFVVSYYLQNNIDPEWTRNEYMTKIINSKIVHLEESIGDHLQLFDFIKIKFNVILQAVLVGVKPLVNYFVKFNVKNASPVYSDGLYILLLMSNGQVALMDKSNGEIISKLTLPHFKYHPDYTSRVFCELDYISKNVQMIDNPSQYEDDYDSYLNDKDSLCTVIVFDEKSQIQSFTISMNDFKIISTKTYQSDKQIVQIVPLNFYDAKFLPFAYIDINKKVYSSCDVLPKKSLYTFIAIKDLGIISGYKIVTGVSINNKKKNLQLVETWSIKFEENEKIYKIFSAKSDAIDSRSIINYDRSLTMKYVNQNLIVSINEIENEAVVVNVVDAVSGKIIIQSQHNGYSVYLTDCLVVDNFIIYTIYDTIKEVQHLCITDLYEDWNSADSNHIHQGDHFSSFDYVPVLHFTKIYVLSEHIDKIYITKTRMGLTSKMIMFMSKSGKIYQIPKDILNANSTLYPTEDDLKHGAIHYKPKIQLNDYNCFNNDSIIFGITDILIFPSLFESTSYIFAYGLDTFLKPINPSQLFDALGEDFNYFTISLVMGILVCGVLLIRYYYQAKLLKNSW
ncbi:ER membrane protein complex subunit 1, partial [Intoshia linei]